MEEIFNEIESDVQVDESGAYNIKDSGSEESLLIGTDVYDKGNASQYANAFVEGITACPEVLEIPGILTDLSGKSKPVEIIGSGAFICCAKKSKNGKTKRLKVPRQVKIIKHAGFAGMNDSEAFEIEAGSVLETIEDHALENIGRNTVKNDPSKRTGTLILPSTLTSVYKDGFFCCNLFHTIFYYGFHLLNNHSTLEYEVSPKTLVKVTSQYPSGQNIFNRGPNRGAETEAEAEKICMSFVPKLNQFTTFLSLLNNTTHTLLILVSTLIPSPSIKTFSISSS